MSKNKYFTADSSGNLIIPAETAERLGIKPGDKIKFTEIGQARTLRLPMRLEKLYIEATSRCNLNCRTCIRNVWDEIPGTMSEEVFKAILDGLNLFPMLPEKVFFGGFGEPLSHPGIIDMILRVKSMV
jgi:sulfatase maturation enzyme AslB (radical SAM superfamily)